MVKVMMMCHDPSFKCHYQSGRKTGPFQKFVTDAHNNIKRQSIYQNIQYILFSEMVT